MQVKTTELSKTDIYKIVSQSVIPRPIAWIVTEDEGIVNIAPFSYFIPLSSEPATLLVSVGHKSDGTPKDTLANLRKHGKCVVCMVEKNNLKAMHFSSKPLGHEESEAETFGIRTERIEAEYPPMVADSPVAFFCSLMQEVPIGGSTVPLVLEVQEIYIADRVLSDAERLSIAYDPVARVGKAYALCGETIEPPHIP